MYIKEVNSITEE